MAQHVRRAVPSPCCGSRRDGGPWLHLDASLEIPEVQKRAIRELGYGTNSKLMVGFSERIWRRTPPAVSLVPTGRTAAWLPTSPSSSAGRRAACSRARAGVLTNFTGGRHGLEIAQRARRRSGRRSSPATSTASSQVVAAARNGRQSRFTWPSFPWTQGTTLATGRASGPVSAARRGGGWEPPLRRRAHLGECSGLHGGGLRVGRAGGGGDPGGAGEDRRRPPRRLLRAS